MIIHHGYRSVCHSDRSPISGEGGVEESLRKKQIVYIGRVEEKKNIINLIKAFEIFNQKYPDYKLILAGPVNKDFVCHSRDLPANACGIRRWQAGGGNPEKIIPGSLVSTFAKASADRSARDDKGNIELSGYVSGEQKEKLLRESACLVLVSKEEGFGFPILEGFDFGLPVLASDIPVLREVGGDACLYVDPNSVEEVAAGLEKIITDETLRQNLVEQGKEQLKKFDWKITAEKYLSYLVSS
jgi:glycosyltransferase involved in cell wall biosynthesis